MKMTLAQKQALELRRLAIKQASLLGVSAYRVGKISVAKMTALAMNTNPVPISILRWVRIRRTVAKPQTKACFVTILGKRAGMCLGKEHAKQTMRRANQ